MKQMLVIFVVAMAFVFTANGQNQASMNELLSPSANDFSEAKNQGFEVFKILPRGMFDYEKNELSLRGGGAYYSFTKKSHSYNEIPQIELQKDNLSVGFAGADYGMIADLGETPLSEIDDKNKSVSFLHNYQAKKIEAEARNDGRKFRKGFEIDGLKFNGHLAAKVGHTYALRAITYDKADTLVAFKIHRKDEDGSLTIFWKLIEDFEKPVFDTVAQNASVNKTSFVKKPLIDDDTIAKIESELKIKGFTDVKVFAEEKLYVLRGTVPKDKLAEVIQIAAEIAKKPIKNELTAK